MKHSYESVPDFELTCLPMGERGRSSEMRSGGRKFSAAIHSASHLSLCGTEGEKKQVERGARKPWAVSFPQ